MKNEKLKIAIIGSGAITKSQHLPAVLRSPQAELYALVDSQRENAEDLRHKFALKCKVFTDMNDVLGEVDGVIIATPNHTHYPLAKAALEKSIPVLIEKPMTTTYAHAVELAELAEKNNTFILVGYKTRYLPNVRLMKRLLEQGYLGKPIHYHYEFGSRGGWAPLSGYNLSREKSGGGVMVVTGTHFLDRMLYWFGEPESFEFFDDSYGGVEANCKAHFHFKNQLGAFTGSFFFSKSIPLKNKFVMETEKYWVEMTEVDAETIYLFPKDNPEIRLEVCDRDIETGQKLDVYFQEQFEEFAANIRQYKGVACDGRFGALSLKWIEAFYANRQQLEEPWLEPYKTNGEK
ncbi:MAG: hypothetical protein Kow0037_12650 [Calditrichia bacterium]